MTVQNFSITVGVFNPFALKCKNTYHCPNYTGMGYKLEAPSLGRITKHLTPSALHSDLVE